MAAVKSRILIIGGTGYIGKFIVTASARAGHPTFALVRESTAANPSKATILDEFKASGVTIVHGDLYDHDSLVNSIKEVDVVISTVGHGQLADQTKIIAAIKDAGNIKAMTWPLNFISLWIFGHDAFDRALWKSRIHVADPNPQFIGA